MWGGGGGPEKSLRISCGGGIAVNNLNRANWSPPFYAIIMFWLLRAVIQARSHHINNRCAMAWNCLSSVFQMLKFHLSNSLKRHFNKSQWKRLFNAAERCDIIENNNNSNNHDCWSFSMRNRNFLFRFNSLEMLSTYLRLSAVLRRVPLLALEHSENIPAHHLRTVFWYGALYIMI